MDRIETISEAFSMQPHVKYVCTDYEHYYDKPNACKEIKLENIEIGKVCGDSVEQLYYVGYNFEGKKIFQYVATAVNVTYFPTPTNTQTD